MVYAVSSQQVVVPRPTENQVVAGTGAKYVVAAFPVYPVVAGASQDDVVTVRADQDVVSGPPYQGGKGAQSINVLLLVHVALGRIARRARVIIQPVTGGGVILGVGLPRRRPCRRPRFAGIPYQDGGGNQENGADQQRHANYVDGKMARNSHFS